MNLVLEAKMFFIFELCTILHVCLRRQYSTKTNVLINKDSVQYCFVIDTDVFVKLFHYFFFSVCDPLDRSLDFPLCIRDVSRPPFGIV